LISANAQFGGWFQRDERSYLQITNPHELKEKIGYNGKLQTKMADFGHLNYGTSFVGQVYHASKEKIRQACDEKALMAEKSLKNFIHKKDGARGMIAWVEPGGDCSV